MANKQQTWNSLSWPVKIAKIDTYLAKHFSNVEQRRASPEWEYESGQLSTAIIQFLDDDPIGARVDCALLVEEWKYHVRIRYHDKDYTMKYNYY